MHFVARLRDALLLRPTAYAEVAGDRLASVWAAAVVLVVALTHATAGIWRAVAFGESAVAGALFGFAGEVGAWAGAAIGAAAVSRYVFGASDPFAAFLRALALAAAPGVLIIAAAGTSVVRPGSEGAVLPVIAAYRVAAAFVAIRSAGHLTAAQGVGALAGALAAALAAVAVVTVPLNAVLRD